MDKYVLRIINVVGIILICIITVFIVLSIAHDNQNPAMTVVSINKVFPCTKKNDNWIEAKSFRVGEDINIT